MALSPKQQKALELLTCGQGLTYGEIARQVGCDVSTLRDWRNGEGFQAVSYTHLDVYKRQVLTQPQTLIFCPSKAEASANIPAIF